jgi:hypothetical protein
VWWGQLLSLVVEEELERQGGGVDVGRGVAELGFEGRQE